MGKAMGKAMGKVMDKVLRKVIFGAPTSLPSQGCTPKGCLTRLVVQILHNRQPSYTSSGASISTSLFFPGDPISEVLFDDPA